MIRVEVTVCAGPIQDPLIGYQKITMVPLSDDGDAGAVLDVSQALKAALTEATESVEAQAAWHAKAG